MLPNIAPRALLTDITELQGEAIVSAADESLSWGVGLDGTILRGAGSGLLAECQSLGGCKTGKAKIAGDYYVPAKDVIHTAESIGRTANGMNQPSSLRAITTH